MDPIESTAGSDPRAAWLEALGYRIAYRNSGFCECLLSRGSERWHGRGIDSPEAFEDALTQAFPSHAARALLDRELAARARISLREEGPAAGAGPAVEPPPTHEGASPTVPARAPAEVAREETASTTDADLTTLVLYPATPARVEAIDRTEALLRLDDLSEVIEHDAGEAPLWTPERQRLLLLGWISHARAVEEASRGDRDVRERVHKIAVGISTLAKVWWPGSVRALRIDATPSDCASDLESLRAEAPRTWLDIAQAAEESLQALAERDELEGRDELGWSDASALEPAPPQPDALLREVQNELEDRSGPLRPESWAAGNSVAPLREASSVSAWDKRVGREGPQDPLEIAAYERLAMKLRWMRRSVSDVETWGAAVGRLRRAATSLPAYRVARLLEILHPLHQPPRTWAQVLGYDPGKKARMRRRREVLRSAPIAEEAIGGTELLDWLKRAFDLGDELKSAQIAEILAPHGALVLALDSDLLADLDRAQRRRLRKVQEALREPVPPPADPDSEMVAAGADEIEEEEVAGARSLEERLLTVLLPKTRGAEVLVVGNRSDPDLDRRLLETFGFGALDRCDVSPRRVDSARERIAAGKYDFVLSATGFLPHKVDGVLKEACRNTETPYVRVRKGRNLACVLHLARELGVAAPAS